MSFLKKNIFSDSGQKQDKDEIKDSMWLKCEKCGEILYRKELERGFWVCKKCRFHFKIDSLSYLKILIQENEFYEIGANLRSMDPLCFVDSKSYPDRLKTTMDSTNISEALIAGHSKIKDIPVALTVMDFRFIGGSMGSVVGERFRRAVEFAINENLPVVSVTSSGGARMQEGILSLMQMAKTSVMVARFAQKKRPFIVVLTNPTTAGVMASFASLGDILIAEPGALLGFAGPRVIKQTIGEDLPPNFQSSEFMLEHGLVDMIVDRREMLETIENLLKLLGSGS